MGARSDRFFSWLLSPRLLIVFASFTLVFLALQIALIVHINTNGDIFADLWERFKTSDPETRIVNNTDEPDQDSSLRLLSVFLQSGLCSLVPGVLLLASLNLACTAARRKAGGYIDTTQ